MARNPMVTRTFSTTTVKALCVNISKEETFYKDFILPRTFKSKDDILKYLSKLYATDTEKIISVLDIHVEDVLYGMDEKTFIENAKILPARK